MARTPRYASRSAASCRIWGGEVDQTGEDLAAYVNGVCGGRIVVASASGQPRSVPVIGERHPVSTEPTRTFRRLPEVPLGTDIVAGVLTTPTTFEFVEV